MISLAWLKKLLKRREAPPRPWSLSPEEVRAGFDRVRSAIPVDDDELQRAKPAREPKKRLS
jgi:hypothetical protein